MCEFHLWFKSKLTASDSWSYKLLEFIWLRHFFTYLIEEQTENSGISACISKPEKEDNGNNFVQRMHNIVHGMQHQVSYG